MSVRVMTIRSMLLGGLIIVGGLSMVDSATALPTALVTDVAIVNPASGVHATAAVGASTGNDTPGNALAALNNSNVFDTGLTWVLAGSSDDSQGGPFTGNPGGTSGTLVFDEPVTGSFVVALKASNAYSLYYFDSTNHNTLDGVQALSFVTSGVSINRQGRPQALSHASLYLTQDLTPLTPQPNTSVSATTPEVSTLTLGLLGAGVLLLRRRHRLRTG